jgi:hypothetical protein
VLTFFPLSDIAKYFGESTTDGIQFQFRTIKKDAAAMKAAADKGENPAGAFNLGTGTSSAGSTPAKATPKQRRPTASASAKIRGPIIKRPPTDDSEQDSESDENNDSWENNDTPTKPRSRVLNGRVTKTAATPTTAATSFTAALNLPARPPSRGAASKAAAVILSQTVDLTTSESEVDTPVNVTAPPPTRAAQEATKPALQIGEPVVRPYIQPPFAAPAAPMSYEPWNHTGATSFEQSLFGDGSIDGLFNSFIEDHEGEI